MIAKNGVTCGISSAVYAVKYSFSMAGDAIDSALDAVHDVAFPPACGGPCGSEGQARVALSNREFRRWFHQVYKQQENFGGGGRDNPDMTADEILDAYDEWNENQQKNEPDCE